MSNNVRPESMERITNFELANAFIEEQIAQVRAQVANGPHDSLILRFSLEGADRIAFTAEAQMNMRIDHARHDGARQAGDAV